MHRSRIIWKMIANEAPLEVSLSELLQSIFHWRRGESSLSQTSSCKILDGLHQEDGEPYIRAESTRLGSCLQSC